MYSFILHADQSQWFCACDPEAQTVLPKNRCSGPKACYVKLPILTCTFSLVKRVICIDFPGSIFWCLSTCILGYYKYCQIHCSSLCAPGNRGQRVVCHFRSRLFVYLAVSESLTLYKKNGVNTVFCLFLTHYIFPPHKNCVRKTTAQILRDLK